jgi:hypothetical protein
MDDAVGRASALWRRAYLASRDEARDPTRGTVAKTALPAKRDRLTPLLAFLLIPLAAGILFWFAHLVPGVGRPGWGLIAVYAAAVFGLPVAVGRHRGWPLASAVTFGIAAVLLTMVAFYATALGLLAWCSFTREGPCIS